MFEVVDRLKDHLVVPPWVVRELVSERTYESFPLIIDNFSELLLERWS